MGLGGLSPPRPSLPAARTQRNARSVEVYGKNQQATVDAESPSNGLAEQAGCDPDPLALYSCVGFSSDVLAGMLSIFELGIKNMNTKVATVPHEYTKPRRILKSIKVG